MLVGVGVGRGGCECGWVHMGACVMCVNHAVIWRASCASELTAPTLLHIQRDVLEGQEVVLPSPT